MDGEVKVSGSLNMYLCICAPRYNTYSGNHVRETNSGEEKLASCSRQRET